MLGALRQDKEAAENAQAEESAWRQGKKIIIIYFKARAHGYSGLMQV